MSNGNVRIYRGDILIGATYFSMRFDNYAESWNEEKSPVVTLPVQSTVRWAGGQADAVTNVEQVAGAVKITLDVTPRQSVNFTRARPVVDFDENSWYGANFRFADKSFDLSDVFQKIWLYQGIGTQLSIKARDGKQLDVSVPSSQTLFLMDLRQWVPTIQLNMGENGPEHWPAGVTKRFEYSLRFNDDTEVELPQPVTITQGPDWIPLQLVNDATPGSALDWTIPNTPTNDQKGWLKVSNSGQFAYEKQPFRPMKFYGVNLIGTAACASKARTDKLIKRLTTIGYNTVRVMVDSDLMDPRAINSLTFDPARLDNFLYFLYKCGQAGIPVMMDLYAGRRILDNEVFPGSLSNQDFKALLFFNDNARQNWWAFAQALLETRNPYNGKKVKEDPTLAWLSVVNEDSPKFLYDTIGPSVKNAFNTAFLTRFGINWDPMTQSGARYSMQMNKEMYQWMRDKLRSIGVKALLTDSNGGWNQIGQSLNREQLDYVDMHWYWDHAVFFDIPWRAPSYGADGNGSLFRSLGGSLGSIALTRVAGKPFTLSEFCMMGPNQNRAEEAVVFGAVGAIQNWDGMWRFAWVHGEVDIDNPGIMFYANAQQDPLVVAADRAIIALFQRRDLISREPLSVMKLDRNAVGPGNYEADLANALFQGPMATSFDKGDPNGANPYRKTFRRISPLGEVNLSPDLGVMTVRTAKTCAFIAEEGATARAGIFTGKAELYRAVVYATALDGRPLVSSNRILIGHLTDLQNTGTVFASRERSTLTNNGQLPHLVRRGVVKLQLQLNTVAGLRVYRLDLGGNRIESMPFTVTGRTLTFTADTQGPQGATFYYEVTRR